MAEGAIICMSALQLAALIVLLLAVYPLANYFFSSSFSSRSVAAKKSEEDLVRSDFGMIHSPYKLLLVVNMSLKMEKGKIAAQCGHGTLGVYKRSMTLCPNSVRWWEVTGQAKIALKAENEMELSELQKMAKSKGICTYLVEDAGRTQVAAGSRTVLAVGPAPVSQLNEFTAHLKLL